MTGIRTLAACLASVETADKPTIGSSVVPFRQPREIAGFYGVNCNLSPLFVAGRVNACPACNKRSWHVGRITAECASCGTVLPISQAFQPEGKLNG
jgi:hypothetical protein